MKEKLMECGDLQEEVKLVCYNTFHIGGTCKYMVFPRSLEELDCLMKYVREEHLPYFILGNGSNVIFSSKYFDGVMISLKYFDEVLIEKNMVTVGSGVMMPSLAMKTIQHNLSGFEWAVGIPGTVGGCIYGNAEAYKESTFDRLKSVFVLSPSGELKTFLKEELSHAYRTSFFKENPGYVIIKATFCLDFGTKEESMKIVEKRRMKRMLTQPLEYPSAGSVFRNPSPDNPSGKIIEELGLKGTKIGGAEVSKKHANFIINTGNATSKDVRNLIELVHKTVKKEANIDLVMEQEYVGWE